MSGSRASSFGRFGRSDWSSKLIRGLRSKTAAGFRSRRGRCHEPTPVTPHYASFAASALAWRPGLPTVRCTPISGPMWPAIGFFAYGPTPEMAAVLSVDIGTGAVWPVRSPMDTLISALQAGHPRRGDFAHDQAPRLHCRSRRLGGGHCGAVCGACATACADATDRCADADGRKRSARTAACCGVPPEP
jgi:hypothetical protein